MESRDVEQSLARALKKQGCKEVFLSIEATPKAFPAIIITTSNTQPIHPNAVISEFTVQVTIIGPSASQDDEDKESAQHINLNRRLAEKLDKAMPNKILDEMWNLANCVELPPTIEEHNQREYWVSGYTLTLV